MRSKKDYLAVTIMGLFVFVLSTITGYNLVTNTAETLSVLIIWGTVFALFWSALQLGRISARD